ncbi:MAG: AtpZ/AtpI family protein [Oscillospiraceae bacterium]|nr:AtpZ/AtpI family protein [Oscillospiraceae bacterium]
MPRNNTSRGKKKQYGSIARALSFASQIGFTIVACVFIGVFLGKYLDGLFGTSPWLLLVFSLLGAAAAFRSIFSIVKKSGNGDKQ